MFDDYLYSIPKAQKKISKKLREQKYMARIQKECENYVRDNPEEFRKAEKVKFKLDLVDYKGYDNDQNKKKSKKDSLDDV